MQDWRNSSDFQQILDTAFDKLAVPASSWLVAYVSGLEINVAHAMTTQINLRRNPRKYALVGVLVILVAILMLLDPDRSWGDVVFGSLFIVGGLIAITFVHRLRVDKDSNELLHQVGVIVSLRTRRFPLNKVKAVSIAVKVERANDQERTTFPVRLNGVKDSTVLTHRNPWFSRVVAEQIARLIEKPLVNRVYGKTSTRLPSELEMPLVDRWRKDGKRFERPSQAYASDLRELSSGTEYELLIPAQFPALKYLIALMLLLIVPAVLDVGFNELFHSGAYRIVALIFLGFAVLSLAFVGRSRLTISSRDVTFRQGFFPLRARLAVKDIEELVIAADGITLIGDNGAVWVHWSTSKRDSDYLTAVVPYQLQRLAGNA